ncbi:MAG: MarR family winged helix-turn-helix transcriptional regulator [Thermoguttaceae bacterium]
MSEHHESGACCVAELIAQLGRVAYGDGFVEGLTPAQWTVLRFFLRANRFSRTASAFAEFHGTTRGTASQTIKSLVAQHYLTRTRSEADGRSARLDLTSKAEAILAHDPFAALIGAASGLPPKTLGSLAAALQRMLGHVSRARGKRPFGRCTACAHLGGDGCCREGQPAYECRFMGEALQPAEIELICINFEPGKSSAMRNTFGGPTGR